MSGSIRTNIEIYGPRSRKPLRPTAELITVIAGESYLKLDRRSKALANFLGISPPLARVFGLAVLQKSRNEAIKAAELPCCVSASPAADLLGNAPQLYPECVPLRNEGFKCVRAVSTLCLKLWVRISESA